jgi:hypothetical protein
MKIVTKEITREVIYDPNLWPVVVDETMGSKIQLYLYYANNKIQNKPQR